MRLGGAGTGDRRLTVHLQPAPAGLVASLQALPAELPEEVRGDRRGRETVASVLPLAADVNGADAR